jgi:hypothetical protein
METIARDKRKRDEPADWRNASGIEAPKKLRTTAIHEGDLIGEDTTGSFLPLERIAGGAVGVDRTPLPFTARSAVQISSGPLQSPESQRATVNTTSSVITDGYIANAFQGLLDSTYESIFSLFDDNAGDNTLEILGKYMPTDDTSATVFKLAHTAPNAHDNLLVADENVTTSLDRWLAYAAQYEQENNITGPTSWSIEQAAALCLPTAEGQDRGLLDVRDVVPSQNLNVATINARPAETAAVRARTAKGATIFRHEPANSKKPEDELREEEVFHGYEKAHREGARDKQEIFMPIYSARVMQMRNDVNRKKLGDEDTERKRVASKITVGSGMAEHAKQRLVEQRRLVTEKAAEAEKQCGAVEEAQQQQKAVGPGRITIEQAGELAKEIAKQERRKEAEARAERQRLAQEKRQSDRQRRAEQRQNEVTETTTTQQTEADANRIVGNEQNMEDQALVNSSEPGSVLQTIRVGGETKSSADQAKLTKIQADIDQTKRDKEAIEGTGTANADLKLKRKRLVARIWRLEKKKQKVSNPD